MSTWGSKIFEDDVALDIKCSFEDALDEGKSVEEATHDVLKENAPYFQDEEDAPVAYWTLALLQLEHGGLTDDVSKKALHYITVGADLERWREEGDPRSYAARKRVVDQLHGYLLHPETFKPKQKRKNKEKQTPYQEGDWFAVPLEGGTYAVGILARVPQLKKHRYNLFAYFFGPKLKNIPSLAEPTSFKPSDSIYYAVCFGVTGLMSGEWPIIGRFEDWNRTKWPLPLMSAFRSQVGGSHYFLIELDDENPGEEKALHKSTEDECNNYWGIGSAGYKFVESMLGRILSGAHVEKCWNPLKH